MKIFECEKCNSKDVFVEQNGNNIGLYCSDCGKWIKWLNKDELRLAERQIKEQEKRIRNKAIDEFVDKSWELLGAEDRDIYARESIKEIAEQMKGE